MISSRIMAITGADGNTITTNGGNVSIIFDVNRSENVSLPMAAGEFLVWAFTDALPEIVIVTLSEES